MRKSLLYYLGEIAVVTIGIFVAIQLNNLNESKKHTKESLISLKRIQSDLQVEKYIIEAYKKQLSNSTRYLKEVLYNKDFKDLDSIVYHTTHYFTQFNINAEYVNLKSSGKLHLIENDSLRYDLVRYYEGYHAYYKEISESQKIYLYDYVIPYYQNEFPGDTTSLVHPELVEDKLKDRRFRNIILDQFGNYRMANTYLETTPVDRLIESIEMEIK